MKSYEKWFDEVFDSPYISLLYNTHYIYTKKNNKISEDHHCWFTSPSFNASKINKSHKNKTLNNKTRRSRTHQRYFFYRKVSLGAFSKASATAGFFMKLIRYQFSRSVMDTLHIDRRVRFEVGECACHITV